MLTRRVATAALRRTTPAAAPAGRRNYVDNVKEIQDYGAEIQREDAAEPIVQNYPVLPEVSRQRLSPFGWTDMLERRNHGDVVHAKHELLSMWGPDVPVIEPHVALRRLALAMLGFISLGAFVKTAMTPEHPAVRREYPFSGLSRELGGPEENQAREESLEEED
ncbi:hypothetical protein BDV98DRAFT_591049 [Pterulicium gracile]|uniref:Uncharacterized protein n=1 Tax=Pterulicium gracile TaxID=1884261 RepID=A0A5C3QUM6_9AGAR|nr:hypothetical protein BDV98DRAFT_591049 [Pterula gracilis]